MDPWKKIFWPDVEAYFRELWTTQESSSTSRDSGLSDRSAGSVSMVMFYEGM